MDERFLRKLPLPVFILDRLYNCKFSNSEGILSVGDNLNIARPSLKMENSELMLVTLKKQNYSARITPINDEFLFCALYSQEDAFQIACKANAYDTISSQIVGIEMDADNLWTRFSGIADSLRKNRDYKLLGSLLEAEETVVNICADTRWIKEYLRFQLVDNEKELIEANEFVSDLVTQCNYILMGQNRFIQFASDNELYFIKANTRYAMFALINLLENSLEFSPLNADPFVVVYKDNAEGKNMIVLKVVNQYLNTDMEPNKKRRKGAGIEAVRNFVKEAKGSFEIIRGDNKITVLVSIPEYVNETGTVSFASSTDEEENKRYLKELTDIFMRRVLLKLREN